MRPFWIGTAVLLLAAACARSPGPPHSASRSGAASPAPNTAVNPANIKKVVRELPPGYEVSTGIPDGASPRVIWGLAADATAKPPQCATLADPGNGRDQSAQGVSGSGGGGMVDGVLVAFPAQPGPVDLDHNVVAACGQWTMAAAHTTVSVRRIDP